MVQKLNILLRSSNTYDASLDTRLGSLRVLKSITDDTRLFVDWGAASLVAAEAVG